MFLFENKKQEPLHTTTASLFFHSRTLLSYPMIHKIDKRKYRQLEAYIHTYTRNFLLAI